MSSVISEHPILYKRIAGGYLIGKVMFIASLGLDYLYMLWQNPGKRISCAVLENGDKLTDGEAEDLKSDPSLQEFGISLHSEGSTTGEQELSDPAALTGYRARIKELEREESLNNQDQGELNWLKGLIKNTVFQGSSKNFGDDGERCMRRVCKNITRAIADLIKHPDTEVMVIGLHLKDNVSTGYECRYVGNRNLMSQM